MRAAAASARFAASSARLAAAADLLAESVHVSLISGCFVAHPAFTIANRIAAVTAIPILLYVFITCTPYLFQQPRVYFLIPFVVIASMRAAASSHLFDATSTRAAAASARLAASSARLAD